MDLEKSRVTKKEEIRLTAGVCVIVSRLFIIKGLQVLSVKLKINMKEKCLFRKKTRTVQTKVSVSFVSSTRA